jgi:Ca-activated chloride channel family protein
MTFAQPAYLTLLIVPLLGAFAYVWLARWRRAALGRFAPGAGLRRLSPDASPRLRAVTAGLVVAALIAVVVALARPQAGERERVVEQEGADVVIALDVSRSMLADDLAPNRLQHARRAADELIERLDGHRVGLVIFAGSPLLRAPLTTDETPLHTMVASAQFDSLLLEPGSDVGGAIDASLRALEAGEAQSRAVVLLSDGEDHDGRVLAAALDASRQGVVVHAAGFGTETGALVPQIDPVTGRIVATEQAGEETTAVSRLDEASLRQAAASAGGQYQAAAVGEIADSLQRLERTRFVVDREDQPVELFPWFVLAAMVLLAAELLLPERSFRISLPRLRVLPHAVAPLLVLVALLFAACGSEASDLIADGNAAYERGDYQAALEAYQRAQAEAPDRPEAHVNAGLALHQLDQPERAIAETRRALPVDDPLLAARIHYNLGGHWFALGRYAEAVSEYRQSLMLNPNERDAKHNLELAQRLLDDLLAQGEQPSGDPSGDPGPGQQRPGSGQQSPGTGQGGEPSGSGATAEQSLADALAGIDEEFTVEEALRALDAVRALNEAQPPIEGEDEPESDRPDY